MSRRRTKRVSSLIIGILLALFAMYLNQHPETAGPVVQTAIGGSYRVTEFVDGDTIVVDMNGASEKIRLIGIDTPETKDPRKTVQCFGKAASEFTKNLIGTNPVRLESDPLGTNRDRYDRLLRYVYLPDGRLVNAEVIKQGYGFAYLSFPFSKSDEFAAYEKSARDASIGLWGSCDTTEQNGREQSAPAI